MTCHPFTTPEGGRGFVCTSGRAKRCRCGRRATLECDWKVPTRKSGTCDAPICASCATSPAPGKDLCATHAAEWRAMQAGKLPA